MPRHARGSASTPQRKAPPKGGAHETTMMEGGPAGCQTPGRERLGCDAALGAREARGAGSGAAPATPFQANAAANMDEAFTLMRDDVANDLLPHFLAGAGWGFRTISATQIHKVGNTFAKFGERGGAASPMLQDAANGLCHVIFGDAVDFSHARLSPTIGFCSSLRRAVASVEHHDFLVLPVVPLDKTLHRFIHRIDPGNAFIEAEQWGSLNDGERDVVKGWVNVLAASREGDEGDCCKSIGFRHPGRSHERHVGKSFL